MRILITAGNTWTMLDKVRCITNIFSGKTGAALALEAYGRGHAVTLATSNAQAVPDLACAGFQPDQGRWETAFYRTFEDLQALLEKHVAFGRYDAILHSAAVSDYRSAGIFASDVGTQFDPKSSRWNSRAGVPTLVDRGAGKVKSDEDELWVRLVRTPKLVDFFREPWGFRGVLVKFKLEVGRSDRELLEIAERSRRHSRADWMVANTLEDARSWAYLGFEESYTKIDRASLPNQILTAVERTHAEKTHG